MLSAQQLLQLRAEQHVFASAQLFRRCATPIALPLHRVHRPRSSGSALARAAAASAAMPGAVLKPAAAAERQRAVAAICALYGARVASAFFERAADSAC